MYGPNVGLEIGKRALLAQQLSLNITGHNIANVNTPGFTRQQAVMTNGLPLRMPFGSVGTGVDVDNIRRLRSEFLDQQMRAETHKLGKWGLMSQSWGQVEAIFNEPEDNGFSAILDRFWNSWQDLSADPGSEAARTEVREQASLLVNSFHHFSAQLTDLRNSLDGDIAKMAGQVNSLSAQVAELNGAISTAELTGNPANDLRDQRDQLVDMLSEYADISTLEKPNGQITVYLGSMSLVDGISHLNLGARTTSVGANIVHSLYFEGTGVDLEKPGGKLEGLLEMRDDVAVGKQRELDLLARELARAVNEVHKAGVGANGSTGINFFNPETQGAADIALNLSVAGDVSYIAAGKSGEPGDNSNALEMAALRTSLKLKDGKVTFGD